MITVTLAGRIARDPEVKEVSGHKLATFSIPQNDRKNPTNKELTTWYEVKVWGKTAEFVERFFKKGSWIGVTGELGYDRWTDKNTGEPKSKPVINADRAYFVGNKVQIEDSEVPF